MLDLSAVATISAVTPNKLGKGEEGTPAITLTMKSLANTADVAMIMGNEKLTNPLHNLFWNDEGVDIAPFVNKLVSDYIVADATVHLGEKDSLDGTDKREVFHGVKFTAKTATPTNKPDIWRISFSVMFTDPNPEVLHEFVAALKGEVKIQVVGSTEDMLDAEPGDLFEEDGDENYAKTDERIMTAAKDNFSDDQDNAFEDFVSDNL